MATTLTSVVVGAKAKHTATVFWFHGLGDSGAGPSIPITLNQGMRMPGWFDLTGLDRSSLSNEDEKGILSSLTAVNGLIRQEVDNGIPSDRIIVGGFSQGCVLSLLTGLTSEYKFGGVIGCSGWLALAEKFPSMASEANKKTPILMCHGDSDPVVQYSYGKESASVLENLGYNIKFNTYRGLVHSASPQELQDIASFLKEHLPPVSA
ncbi:hypothetical protein INT45_007975 [Circinella minor]|uniref:Acyl-protein thioesterase 1 n=1 Tax=Circinella minor TaxID=1195481 RepID=A0A8H7S1Y6_9FUNG|nr:hypothetical protein INT45_007975 [Circinella minor]